MTGPYVSLLAFATIVHFLENATIYLDAGLPPILDLGNPYLLEVLAQTSYPQKDFPWINATFICF